MRENLERAFKACGEPMDAVSEFRYLRRLLTATDDDWPVVDGNIKKSRRKWGRLARVLGREEADPKVSQTFYIAVTHTVLLFGSETWVLTARLEKALDNFQSRVAEAHRETATKRDRLDLVLPFTGGRNEGGRDCLDSDVIPLEAEYVRAIYCDADASVPV